MRRDLLPDVFGVEAESALSLGRGEGAIATITYEPNLVGLHSASLVIVSDSAGSTSAEAAIRGQAGLPSAGIAPRVLDFGLLSGSLPVSIAPTTAFPLTVEGLELSGAIDDFSTSMATTFGELPLTLSAGQQLSVQVLFHPTVEIPVEATLWILTNDPNASEVGVALIGNSSCDGGTALLEDIDGDGFSPCADDCDDHDASIYPGAPELADGLDNNCNDLIDEGTNAADDDGDTYSEDEGDCHDGDPEISPDATETANGVDDDCDGTVDEDTAASDDDGDGFTEEGGDCDDTDPEIAPGQTDIEDGIDNDCDGIIDNGTSAGDDDGDGFSEAQGDCHDGNANVYPGANESPNGVDDDCDGTVDEGTVNVDDDGDGFTESGGDCDDTEDTAHPGGTEVAGNGIDEDCDGFMD